MLAYLTVGVSIPNCSLRCLCITGLRRDRFLPHLKRNTNQAVHRHGVKNQEIQCSGVAWFTTLNHTDTCLTRVEPTVTSEHVLPPPSPPGGGGSAVSEMSAHLLKTSPRLVLPFLFGFVLFLNIETASYKEKCWRWSRQHKQTVQPSLKGATTDPAHPYWTVYTCGVCFVRGNTHSLRGILGWMLCVVRFWD